MTCGTYPTPPTRSAQIGSDGKVSFCTVPELTYPPGSNVPLGCFQNWNSAAPILPEGRTDLFDGTSCSSEADGIVCTKVAGPATGRGFLINRSEAVEVVTATPL